jgi:hypothetical protein
MNMGMADSEWHEKSARTAEQRDRTMTTDTDVLHKSLALYQERLSECKAELERMEAERDEWDRKSQLGLKATREFYEARLDKAHAALREIRDTDWSEQYATGDLFTAPDDIARTAIVEIFGENTS